jgi:hypothetical protein
MSDDAPTPAPKRRWFRWSLRTLFVVLTLLCIVLGYHARWIAQRRQFIARNDTLMMEHTGELMVGPQQGAAPGLLRFLGEPAHPLFVIWVEGETPDSLTAADLAALREVFRLFPEINSSVGFAHDAKWASSITKDPNNKYISRKLPPE